MVGPPPLTGLKVLEFAGLAPGPFAGLLLADAGASVLRIDRPPPPPTPPSSPSTPSTTATPTPSDQLTRHKASIAVDLKSRPGRALVLRLAREADVLIDPFRPGVMERLGLGPEVFLGRQDDGEGEGEGEGGGGGRSGQYSNPRLVYARLTGFRRDGRYRDMAGHDINYLAVSGVLGMLGGQRWQRKHGGEGGGVEGVEGGGGETMPPTPPVNILGDFAGGGAVLFQGILMALMVVSRHGGHGGGQVVEANMVDGAGYLATHPRLARGAAGSGPPGTNLLDGGCPYYATYRTLDGGYMAVGALEPRFFAGLVRGLGLEGQGWEGRRHDRSCWGGMRRVFARVFGGRTRDEWEGVFGGTDACCTPVLDYGELEGGRRGGGRGEGDQRPIVTLRGTPCLAVDTGAMGGGGASTADGPSRGQGPGVPGDGYVGEVLVPGEKGEERLREWMGWERGKDFEVGEGGGLALLKTVAKL